MLEICVCALLVKSKHISLKSSRASAHNPVPKLQTSFLSLKCASLVICTCYRRSFTKAADWSLSLVTNYPADQVEVDLQGFYDGRKFTHQSNSKYRYATLFPEARLEEFCPFSFFLVCMLLSMHVVYYHFFVVVNIL